MTLDARLIFPRAALMSRAAHAGQFDRAGQPYYEHPRAVARCVQRWLGLSPHSDEVVAAFLHDVIEDTATTLGDLHAEGFTPRSIFLVECLTRKVFTTYEKFIDDICHLPDPAVRFLKIADIEHNLSRMDHLPEVDQARLRPRYEAARARLYAALSVDAIEIPPFPDWEQDVRLSSFLA